MNKLATIFSIVTTVGLLLAAVSGVVWIISALRNRETVAKALCLAGLVVAVVGFVMFLRSYDSSLHRERSQEPQLPAVQSETQGQPQEPAQGPVSEPVKEPEGTTPTAPQEPIETPQGPTQAGESENPLDALPLQTRPVMNGFKTERIGTWAYIETTKSFMAGVTDQQLYDYLTGLSTEGYNWFNVFFEDGTGLWTFSPAFIEYGKADQDEGGSVEYIGDASDCIFTFIDGQYSTNG